MIAKAVETVAALAPKDLDSITDIAHLAGKTWLEIQKERYRVRVWLPEGSGDILTSGSPSRRLTLIIRPSLTRFGNGQGHELTKDEVVAGWKGDEVVYEAQ
jgi:hypothetical protein